MTDNDHAHDHDENDVEEAFEEALELDTQSQIFLEMRRQNIDLLRIAAEVAGYTGPRPPLKPGDAVKQADTESALRAIWTLFAEFYTWIDPEESDDDDDDDDDDEDDADDDL